MRFSRSAIFCAAILGLVSVSFAQGPGGGRGFGRGGGRSLISLAGIEAVQKEIAVSDEAKEKITKLTTTYGEEMRSETSAVGGGRDASPEERRAAMAKLTEARTKLDAKFVPQLKEILSADQFKRVQEIHRQDQGAQALTNAEFAKELGISDEQSKKITDIIQDYSQKTRALFTGGEGGGADNAAKMQELNKERDEKVVEVLSPEQKEKFTAAKGKPFDLAQIRQGGRPGGNRGQRPQNN